MRTITRFATASAAALALLGGFASTADAKAGQLFEGEEGTDGNLTIRVDRVAMSEPGTTMFRATTCLSSEATKNETVKASDFTVTDTQGTVHQVKAQEGTDAYPDPSSSTLSLEPGMCVDGELVALDMGGEGKTVNYKSTLIQWTPSTSGEDGIVAYGETARNDQGLSVTLSGLVETGNHMWTMQVKACSTHETQFGWDDISVVEKVSGDLMPLGNHEGDVLGAKALPFRSTIKAGECVTGSVSFVSEWGPDSFMARGLIFTVDTDGPQGDGDATPTPGKPTKPSLPKTGN